MWCRQCWPNAEPVCVCCLILRHMTQPRVLAASCIWTPICNKMLCFLPTYLLSSACRRNDNLQARVTAKADKKKAKREKKLLRPGFEGRRSGFIPSPGGGGGGGCGSGA